jgi:hypothetical protein
MKNLAKAKLKRRGNDMYNKYFYNSDNIIEYIIKQIDNNNPIDENICEVVINVNDNNIVRIYELITYYPNKLREIKFIDDNIVNELYLLYGETISIMNESKEKSTKFKNVRGKMFQGAAYRAKQNNIEFNITNESIILNKHCKLLNIPIEYGQTKVTKNSPSIDRIDNSKGYIEGNIQVISSLGNSMKNSATKEELITFANNILKIYK